MNTKGLYISGGVILVTVLLVVAYSLFNVLGVTQSRVVRNEITIVTGSAVQLYDGTSLSNDEWYIESGSLAEGDTLVTSMNTSLIEPDTIPNDIGVTILNSDGENVTVNYRINYKLGTLRVLPLDLTISTASVTKYYDGTPLTNEEWTLQAGALLDNHHIEYTMSSSITNPGTIDNEVDIRIVNENGQNMNHLYGITYNLGKLSVVETNLTISTESFEKVYNGTPLLGGTPSITSGNLVDGHTIVYGSPQSLTIPDSIDNDVSITIFDSDGNDVTIGYNITEDFGTLTVFPMSLVIRSADDSKIYDGTPLSNSNWTLTHGQLSATHELVVTVNREITNVGSIENTINATVQDQSGNDVTYMYDIEYDPGTLTIEAKNLIIETGSASKTYDGTPLTNDEWTVVFGQLSTNHRMVVQMTSTITLPGEEDNRIYVQILDENDEDVTDEYDIDYEYGTLRVTGIPITVSTEDLEKSYDGTPLIGGTGTITFGTLVASHTISYGPEQSITNPGSIVNEIQIRIYDGDGLDVTDAYDIDEDFGRLTVDPITLVLKSPDASKNYDGTPLSDNTWELFGGGPLLSGHVLVVDVDNQITLPGTIDNTMNAFVIDAVGNDVSDLYDFEYITGELTVFAREITITTDTIEKDYDGVPIQGGSGTITSGSLLATHYIVYGSENSFTLPNTIDNDITYTIYDGNGIIVTDGYDITEDFGTLTIRPITLTISSVDDSKSYDGMPLSNSSWQLISGSLLAGHALHVTVDNEITNPGSIDNDIVAFVTDAFGTDVSDIYEFNLQPGTLTIEPIAITITTNDLSKSYDGTPLLGGSGTVTSGSLLPTHYIVYGTERSITLPGTISNDIDITVFDGSGNDVTIAYDITENFGDLTVQPITIILKSPDAEKAYDGTPLSANSWELLSGSLLAGHSLIVDVDNQITNPGSIDNTINAYILDGNGTNVSDYYDLQFITGTLTVLSIDITVSTDTLEKDYDGSPLTGNSGAITFGTLLAGHYIVYGPENSITNPGTIDNDLTIHIYDSLNNDVTVAYTITEDFGTLTIHPITIVLQSPDANKPYDGTPLSDNTWDQISGILLPGHNLIVVMDNEITLPGTIDNTMLAYVNDALGNDVTDNYDIQYLTGVLTVDGIPITITTITDSKAYDGTALLGGLGTQTAGSLLPSHTISYGTQISITNPGSVSNAIDVTILDGSGNDVTAIYDITESFGTLTITPISIIIKSPDASKIYDGTPLTANTWELVTGDVILGHTLYVDIDNSITDVGSISNTMFAYVLDGQGNVVTDYYNIVHDTGTLTIFSSAYSGSEIATNSFDIPVVDAFQVYSGASGLLYFRDRSFADYTLTGWTQGVDQDTTITENPLQFPSITLEEYGYSSVVVQVEYLREQIPYLSPYFTTDPLAGTSDIHTTGDTTVIDDLNVIFYTYDDLDSMTIQDVPLSVQEQVYRDFVYANYLDVPASTLQSMLTLAATYSLDPNSPTIISDVQSYIRGAATYNLNFAPIPPGEDVAVYFLTVSKEGICQHYATAATLMYRALGIPARYVTGYASNVTATQWTTVTSEKAHAWVEVYIDGFGWVPVEVTGSAEPPIEITVYPNTVREIYEEGKTITASSLLILGYPDFAADGYTYAATFDGSLSTIGTAVSSISSITIYDSLGFDVTYKFDITTNDGILQLYGYQIEVVTSSDSKNYDGTALTNSNYVINGSLEPNHHVEYELFTGEQTYVGASKNTAFIHIYDDLGNNVTSLYNITYTYGDLVVLPAPITIESDSGTKVFDGTPLTVDSYTVSAGVLAPTDTIEITITGSQTGIGKSNNTVSSIVITNNGVDVTSNYIIEIIEGELTVTPF